MPALCNYPAQPFQSQPRVLALRIVHPVVGSLLVVELPYFLAITVLIGSAKFTEILLQLISSALLSILFHVYSGLNLSLSTVPSLMVNTIRERVFFT